MTTNALPVFVRVIIKDHGRYLVLRESRGEQLWNFPGGRHEMGESIEATAEREVREETGLTVVGTNLVLQKSFEIRDTRWMGIFYLATKVLGNPEIKEPATSAMEFFREAEMEKLPSIREVLQDLLLLDPVRTLESSF